MTQKKCPNFASSFPISIMAWFFLFLAGLSYPSYCLYATISTAESFIEGSSPYPQSIYWYIHKFTNNYTNIVYTCIYQEPIFYCSTGWNHRIFGSSSGCWTSLMTNGMEVTYSQRSRWVFVVAPKQCEQRLEMCLWISVLNGCTLLYVSSAKK